MYLVTNAFLAPCLDVVKFSCNSVSDITALSTVSAEVIATLSSHTVPVIVLGGVNLSEFDFHCLYIVAKALFKCLLSFHIIVKYIIFLVEQYISKV
jgi:hypothetical protein